MSGLFGDTDAAEIPDNPFYVAPDTYECVLAEANRVMKKDQSGEGLAFKWVIEDEGDYFGNNVQDWKNIYPDVPREDKTADMRKDESRLKGRLLEMGVPENEMGDLLDNLDSLVGLRAFVTVTESKGKNENADKTYTNVQSVRIED